jgi:methyl-accepting chemotaxis protein
MKVNMSIGTRILIGYGLAMFAFGAVGLVTYRAITGLIDTADWVAHTHKVKEALAVMLGSLRDAETGQRGFVITGRDAYLEPYGAAVNSMDGELRRLSDLIADNQRQQRRLETLRPLVAERLTVLASVIEARRKQGARAAAEMVGNDRGKMLMDQIRGLVAEMDREESDLLLQRNAQARLTARFAFFTLVGGGLALTLIVGVVGYLTRNSITGPLAEFMEFAGCVGAGDLTQQSRRSSADELGELGKCLDQMVVGLREVAGQTRAATASLSSASAEILASTQQQAASTAEQAAAVQQTTVTMEELAQSGAQIAERAKQVAASAEGAATASRAGLQAMDRSNRTMQGIREQAESVAENVVALSEKTQAIGEIIATVNDLAEQSHLLALNAAIEAAAAGEHGRSFSVIASEVKNLADQSREATVQVRGILGDIQRGINTSVMRTEEAVKRVESGKQQTEVADQTIRTMADTIQQSVQAFQQIAAGSNQQQLGFAQVMQAIRDIRQASQQSASGTQQLERAALSLSALSQQLQKTVERYRV